MAASINSDFVYQIQHPEHNEVPLKTSQDVQNYLDEHDIPQDVTIEYVVYTNAFVPEDEWMSEGDPCRIDACDGELMLKYEEEAGVTPDGPIVHREFWCEKCANEGHMWVVIPDSEE